MWEPRAGIEACEGSNSAALSIVISMPSTVPGTHKVTERRSSSRMNGVLSGSYILLGMEF